MEATIARALQVLIALSGAYLAALWVVLIVWTYRDIESRSRSVVTQVFSTMLSALFFVPGVLLYMMLRPKETLDLTFQRSLEEEYLLQDLETNVSCPHCNRAISDEFVVCPHCHTKLKEACENCSREIDVRWSLCPYCGHEKGGPLAEIRPVIQPIERFVQSDEEPIVRELPTTQAIEQLEAQAFYRMEGPPAPAAIATNAGRAFDRRKTREMHRARNLNGRTEHAPSPNGNGHENGVSEASLNAKGDTAETSEVGSLSTDTEV
ncbi:MAG TPA: zinc ribbon domain-containing protein [Thermomicrobiales bacterium]|jgi:RNA polymerase subunit RPABC4/transcription elongation factor Spt4|nr:zinc ribbon domain-containing protein [Thermomicrobiales bacterium]